MTRLQACIGCGILVSPGPRCAECRRKAASNYNATRPQHHALYRTQAWRRLSEEVRRTRSRCTWCEKPLPFSLRIADHIVPLEQRPDLGLEETNLTVSCKGCNTKRGRNARLADPEAIVTTTTVGDRMAAILGGER